MPRAQRLGAFDRVAALRRLDLLRPLDTLLLTGLAQGLEEDRFERGDAVWPRGRPLDRLVLVVEGDVRVEGGEYDGTTLHAPALLAPVAFLAARGDDVEALALDESVTLSVTRPLFEEIVLADPAMPPALSAHLAAHAIDRLADTLPGAHIATLADVSPGREPGWIDRLVIARETGLFPRGAAEAHTDLAALLEPVRLSPGETIWRRGDRGDWALALMSGELRAEAEEPLLFSAGPGFVAGLLEGLCRRPRWYDAEARSEIVAFRFEPAALVRTLAPNPERAAGFVAQLARRVLDPMLWADEPPPSAPSPIQL